MMLVKGKISDVSYNTSFVLFSYQPLESQAYTDLYNKTDIQDRSHFMLLCVSTSYAVLVNLLLPLITLYNPDYQSEYRTIEQRIEPRVKAFTEVAIYSCKSKAPAALIVSYMLLTLVPGLTFYPFLLFILVVPCGECCLKARFGRH